MASPAPPGFNPAASMLPDNPSAHIDVMRGGARKKGSRKQVGGDGETPGGAVTATEAATDAAAAATAAVPVPTPVPAPVPAVPTRTEEDEAILEEYGMGENGPIAKRISEETKTNFLRQIKDGRCNIGTGDRVILHKECSAVVEVIRALIKYDFEKKVRKNLPSSISTRNELTNARRRAANKEGDEDAAAAAAAGSRVAPCIRGIPDEIDDNSNSTTELDMSGLPGAVNNGRGGGGAAAGSASLGMTTGTRPNTAGVPRPFSAKMPLGRGPRVREKLSNENQQMLEEMRRKNAAAAAAGAAVAPVGAGVGPIAPVNNPAEAAAAAAAAAAAVAAPVATPVATPVAAPIGAGVGLVAPVNNPAEAALAAEAAAQADAEAAAEIANMERRLAAEENVNVNVNMNPFAVQPTVTGTPVGIPGAATARTNAVNPFAVQPTVTAAPTPTRGFFNRFRGKTALPTLPASPVLPASPIPSASLSGYTEIPNVPSEEEESEAAAAAAEIAGVTEILNNPTNFRGNISGKRATFEANLTRRNKRLSGNFAINGRKIRVYGNSPNIILRRYNQEKAGATKRKATANAAAAKAKSNAAAAKAASNAAAAAAAKATANADEKKRREQQNILNAATRKKAALEMQRAQLLEQQKATAAATAKKAKEERQELEAKISEARAAKSTASAPLKKSIFSGIKNPFKRGTARRNISSRKNRKTRRNNRDSRNSRR